MKIANWDELYENATSRKLVKLRWVPVPNSHDGEHFIDLMEHDHAAEIFTCWILILQVASKCDPRGSLVRKDGHPYDASSLARRTRAKAEWFEIAIPYLMNIGWIHESATNPLVISRTSPEDLPNIRQSSTQSSAKKFPLKGRKERMVNL